MQNRKVWRELRELAALYGLEYVGLTAKGHHRWRHTKTGRIVITVSTFTSYHALKNAERSIRSAIRSFDGQHPNPH